MTTYQQEADKIYNNLILGDWSEVTWYSNVFPADTLYYRDSSGNLSPLESRYHGTKFDTDYVNTISLTWDSTKGDELHVQHDEDTGYIPYTLDDEEAAITEEEAIKLILFYVNEGAIYEYRESMGNKK